MIDKKKQSRAIKRGMKRAAEAGRHIGRPAKATDIQIREVIKLKAEEAAAKVGLSVSRYIARRSQIEQEDAKRARN